MAYKPRKIKYKPKKPKRRPKVTISKAFKKKKAGLCPPAFKKGAVKAGKKPRGRAPKPTPKKPSKKRKREYGGTPRF